MKRIQNSLLALALGMISATAGAQNVALGKAVTASGSFGGAALSTLTDGVYRPRGTGWQNGTIWWTGATPTLTIDLGGSYTIGAFNLQGDDNDSYRVDYFDGSSWNLAWDVPNYNNYGNGMQTRPDPADDSSLHVLGSPITATMLRVYATGGDGYYSVSELRAEAVPEPATLAILGLGALALRRRRA